MGSHTENRAIIEIIGGNEMAHEIPESFFGWVTAGVSAIVVTLVGTVTALWRINESKNASAIAEQSKQLASIEGELKVVKDHATICEESRVELIKDRAVLATKCDIFEKRLTVLENGIHLTEGHKT